MCVYAWEGGVYGLEVEGSEVSLITLEHTLTFGNIEHVGIRYQSASDCNLSRTDVRHKVDISVVYKL